MSQQKSEPCDCFKCTLERPDGERDPVFGVRLDMMRMFVCSVCGNKRCPHATSHEFECTGSNEPGQKGSRYE